MNDRPRRTILGMRLWLLALMGLLGIMVASLKHIDDGIESPGAENTTVVAPKIRPADEQLAESKGEPDSAVASRSTPVERGVQFRASDGLVFEPARINDRFIGYRVISNRDDNRVEVGDIVVSINGMPVEDSAAGSELFIASMSNPGATVQLYEVSDGERK